VALARLTRRQRPRWRAIEASAPRLGSLAVSYGMEEMAGTNDVVVGGFVKFQALHEQLPNAPRDFNVLYLGSSSMPLEAAVLVRLARRRGAAFVWNQNGVAYPGWYGPGYELVNRPRARLLHEADHVIYQTGFCKLGADTFYGERAGSWEVLANPVDTQHFAPDPERAQRPLTLLLGGSQYQRYRLVAALETFAEDGAAQTAELVRKLALDGAVELAGSYSQRDAPGLMRRADLLLHTKYNDPGPTVVEEAMACGLPVVYSASGGVPELVGEDAGVGIPAPLDWEQDHPPAAADLATAVLHVAERLPERAEAARARAVERFDLRAWVRRHRELFAGLVGEQG
jgi:glycosyltransferase involved in cell wall biosynthesis